MRRALKNAAAKTHTAKHPHTATHERQFESKKDDNSKVTNKEILPAINIREISNK